MANYSVGHISFRSMVTCLSFLMSLFMISPANGQALLTTNIDQRTINKNVTHGVNEKLVYSNTLGALAARVPQNQLIADDLVLTVQVGCPLRRYTFEVTGKVDPFGTGGAYTVQYALYDHCPGAGGQVIPGTSGSTTIPAEQDAAITTVEMIVPDGEVVLLPSSIWIGLKFDRGNCGIMMGAPPLVGVSDDVVDFPGFACSANLGGYPDFGHASYNVQLFADAACEDSFPAYRNVQDARNGYNPGANVWLADDLELNVDSCEMIGYEVAVRGVGFYTFELLRDVGGVPGSTVANTRKLIVHADSGFQLSHFSFDPPIPLDQKIWMAGRVGNDVNGWVLTGKDASVGATANTFVRLKPETGEWEILSPPAGQHGGFYAVIHCLGDPAIGACCTPADSTGDACSNLTEAECNAVEPVGEPRMWQLGVLCNSVGQLCPNPACLGGRGACDDQDHPNRCVGGPMDGQVCELDRDCSGYCDTNTQVCLGGIHEGDPCTNDSTCEEGLNDGVCFFEAGQVWGICIGGEREGRECGWNRDCKETLCKCIPGCSDPFCCTMVCEYLDPFCCNECWDVVCAITAANICLIDCNQNGVSDAEDIISGTSADENLNGEPDECEKGSCCLLSSSCLVTFEEECTDGHWSYQGKCEPNICPPPTDACCDSSEGMGGLCTDNVLPADCQGFHQSWFARTDCSQISCEEVIGACCDAGPGMAGACTEFVISADCQGAFESWSINTFCADVVCEEIKGACCDTSPSSGGTCTDNVLPADCQQSGQLWTTENTCAEIICEEVRGACCDAGPGSGGTCTDDVLSDDCQGTHQSWFDDTQCSVIACEEVTGACCDSSIGLGGLCTDDVLSVDCQGSDQLWSINATCSALVCEEVAGACCDRLDGFCRNGVLRDECDGAQPVWSEGELCSEILCDPAMGACCNTRFGTCMSSIIADCAGTNLSWTKGEDCNVQNCPDPFIPTVSQWGLIIMTLLLMITAKIVFGRASQVLD